MAQAAAVEIAQARELVRSGRAQAIRERNHLSRSEIARGVGVHEATVGRWESGTREPRGEAAIRLGRLLHELAKVAL